MSFAFSTSWRSFRLGLPVFQTRRTAYSTLRSTIGASNQIFSRVDSRCGFPQGSWRPPVLTSSIIVRPDKLQRQSRWVTFWEPPPKEEVLGEMTGESNLSLSQEELEKIFGRKLDPEQGVKILMTLQKHRGDGTLDHEMPFSSDLAAKGLAYLRILHPVDEDAAIIARIDREIDRLPQTNVERSPHAVSQFERLREANKEKYRREKTQREAEEKKREAEKKAEGAGRPKKVEARTEKVNAASNELVRLQREPKWVKKYRQEATNRDESVKDISMWSRLLPSGVVTATVLALSLLFAQYYIPPSQNARTWPDVPPAAATMITLLGLNFVVYALWKVPSLWKFMNRNFLVVPVYPYCTSMIGASFSHQIFKHLAVNALTLGFVGTYLHDDLGRGRFLAIYFASAVLSAYIPMLIYLSKNILTSSTLGASGCACALIATSCVLHEGTTIRFPLIPVKATEWVDSGVLLVVFMLSQVWSLRRHGINPTQGLMPGSKGTKLDYMGHLTGYVSGIGAASIIRYSDPKWGNKERHHFFTKYTSTGKKQPAEQLATPE